jgi:hypothetical protein
LLQLVLHEDPFEKKTAVQVDSAEPVISMLPGIAPRRSRSAEARS